MIIFIQVIMGRFNKECEYMLPYLETISKMPLPYLKSNFPMILHGVSLVGRLVNQSAVVISYKEGGRLRFQAPIRT